ncbi:MAG: DUF2628 domain-containing protein [Pseudomonadota bacterium]
MYKYNVYKHPILGYEPIKQGFSWPGFFFTWVWAFVKKIWVIGVVLLIAVLIANNIGFALTDVGVGGAFIGLFLTLIPMISAGMLGNDWRKDSMRRRGYNLECSVMAETSDGALAEAIKPVEEREHIPVEAMQINELDAIREKSAVKIIGYWKKYSGKEFRYFLYCMLIGSLVAVTLNYLPFLIDPDPHPHPHPTNYHHNPEGVSFMTISLMYIEDLQYIQESNNVSKEIINHNLRVGWLALGITWSIIIFSPYFLWVLFRVFRFLFCRVRNIWI